MNGHVAVSHDLGESLVVCFGTALAAAGPAPCG